VAARRARIKRLPSLSGRPRHAAIGRARPIGVSRHAIAARHHASAASPLATDRSRHAIVVFRRGIVATRAGVSGVAVAVVCRAAPTTSVRVRPA
jgi:hypothetical protein